MNNLKPKVKLVGFSNKSNLACKAIVRSFLFFLILMFAAVSYSQEVFSTSGYPSGTNVVSGKIIFPVQYYTEPGQYTIQFQSGYNPGNVVLTTDGNPIYTCNELETTSSYVLDAVNGKVDFTPGKYCLKEDLEEIRDTLTFTLKVVADGGSNVKYQTFKIPIQRLPVKTALVMDISGSMGWPTSGGDIRWFVLKNSVDLFMQLYEYFRQEGDVVGLTYFTSYVIQPDPPIGAGFIPVTKFTVPPVPPTSKDVIIGDMDLKGPLYATAMGLGLFDAKTKLNSDVVNRYRRIALLFTDGLQNVPPFVMDDGNNLTNGTTLNDAVSEINKIRYFIIATWVPNGAPDVLYNIASASNGATKHTISVNDTETSDNFMGQLESILHGESPQIVGTAVGKVLNNEVSHTVNLNANISKAAFVFDYGTGDSINIVIEKNGTELPVSISTGTGFKIIGLQFPVAGTNETSSGQYKVKVTGNTAKTYKMTCLAEDHHFDYNVSLNKPYYSVGDTIEFTTEISLAGVPLNNPEDSVTIVLFKPGDDVGNLLALYNNADISQALVDEGTSAQQKYEVLFSTDSTFQNSLLPVEQKIVLNNNGNGVFKGEFKNTDVTGVYSMLVFLNVRSETTGIIEREKIITTVFEFAQVVPEPPVVVDNTSITPTDTTAAVAPVPPDSTTTNTNAAPAIVDKFNPVVLQIRPKNKFGYFMGPGYVNKIWAKINPGKAQKPVINKSSLLGSNPPAAGEPYVSYIYGTLDGRYYIYVSDVKERTNPKIEIKVGNELYYSGKIFRIPCWFYLILIVLIILIIIIRYLKSKNKKIYELLLWIFTVICMLILILHYLGYLRFLY